MKNIISRLIPMLLPLLLAACGTFEVTVFATPDSTIPVTLSPGSLVPTPFPASECPPFSNETVLPDNPDDPQSYIGHHYDALNLPEGLTFNGEALVDDIHAWLWVSRPDFDMEFIERLICHDVNGRAYSTVIDAIKIPQMRSGYGRATACSPLPTQNPIIAYGAYDETQPEVTIAGVQGWKINDIDFAVQINLQTMRFEPLSSLKGLECVHGSGLGS